jgi:hypothetical protein
LSLHQDPIAWCQAVAKNRVKLITAILLQILVTLFVLYLFYDSIPELFMVMSFTDILQKSSLIFFVCIGVPSLYLYAIYQLLKEIKKPD